MQKELEEAERQISLNREEIIRKLVRFSETDMLLFWGSDKSLVERQHQKWEPVLKWAAQEFSNKYQTTQSLDVPRQDEKAADKIRSFMEKLNDRQLAVLFASALLMRSVLLACAFVKGRINAEEAYEAALTEELWQAEHWGQEEEAQKRREGIRQELQEIGAFLKS